VFFDDGNVVILKAYSVIPAAQKLIESGLLER
jgi:hypothetical protein